MIYASEALLYFCFAILMGHFILRLVPADRRPDIAVPNGLLLACAIAIPVLSYMPIHQSAVLFAKEFETSYGEMVLSYLQDIKAGKAWIWTVLASLGLSALLALPSFRNDKHMPKVGLFITALLIVWLGYASHASTLYGTKGLLVHTAHFMAVSVWIGILLVVSWFSRGDGNWERMLVWFSPLAIGCFLIALLAGLALMSFTTPAPEYIASWMLPYGQMLLIKHLLLLPLLLFAYTNGFGYRAMLRQSSEFNLVPWLKAESAVALLLFVVTGALGQQTPPHTVRETLQTVSPSPLFTSIFRGSFSPDLALKLQPGMASILLIAAALVMLYGFISMYRSNRLLVASLMGLLASVFGYFALMFGLTA
ncbi:copper resistance D family protein [Paenibacillus sp. NEAU-GSW1]|uniref:copper resistance D family protein n=1 Tax=Paenibacillus sp. NEAU-GSW1 TaxID=2682486 RepID=UPI0012E20F64|nr:CopD family protein [Paenibacillus sp. NEAU-GSW1]MUT67263.1 copper resistance protein CopD [Paenibacillus sp. NEAU-GSW1]